MSTPARPPRSPRTTCCRTWTSSPPGCGGRSRPTRRTWSTRTSGCRGGAPWPGARRSRSPWHAHFWVWGRAALAAARPLGIPVVQTFHALGVVKRRHQGARDTSPPTRLQDEAALAREADRIVATCSDEVFELVRMGADLRRVTVVPCGVDLELFRPDGPVAPGPSGGFRLLVVSPLV